MKILCPLLISRLISFFTPTSSLSKADAYITALGLCLVVVTETTIRAPNFFTLVRFGLALRIAAGSLVYRKVSATAYLIIFKFTSWWTLFLLSECNWFIRKLN